MSVGRVFFDQKKWHLPKLFQFFDVDQEVRKIS